ncbi:cobyrinic acid a,c-diamide synthase [Hydrogenophaga crassostreae]|uniref:Cobyrinic acid a,c-diamide synthase n=1 Tax=Hydrogenophaga crassostreae TaxID=1763535 RepID=A0A167H440_9BURK|nr:cobyrinate a,c-diamide synthase [Hydrogenophaga crassostreae]AOW13056.1 cobyrinic acid a,c-diamide synthase [Hydrogenophaga crassostreae]OAD40240.1 cobyrinic acid a,c-diamide synthase [Hydrogenophaga crassostreae]
MNAVSGCPAILVAAPASGQGKTTVTAALARLHVRAGRRVRAFKSGPDFLDPFWLELATGHPAHNLDLWMTGETDAQARLHDAAQSADLIIVEGVMGLFDGEPSAADLARRFGLHVLAVIDASAMAGTFGALAFGLQHYRPGLPWAGVLANRVASERHADMLQSAVAGDEAVTPSVWLGALMREPKMALPERHLGLQAAHELPDALARLDAAADALSATPLGQMDLAALASWTVAFEPPSQAAAVPPLLAGKTVAIARDAAFSFVYAANLDTLRALGARLTFFSPLANVRVPPCDAVWLPGGYPELHAPTLAANHTTRDSLAEHVEAGRPVWAECGGMMVLFDELVDRAGNPHAMWGLLRGRISMQARLAALGPQRLMLSAGELRGHTFHYSICETPMPVALHTDAMRGGAVAAGEALHQRGALRASYFHAWMPSSPSATAALFLNEDLS